MSAPMVGRVDELRRLTRLASTPGPSVAMLAGEAGIGKTRLVHELIAAASVGTTVLVGHAEPGSLGRPFELLLSAVDGQPGVDEPRLAVLTDPGRSPGDRLQAGLEVLRSTLHGAPAVIAFEDLHWADSESVALFERLGDMEGDRLVVGTYRPAEVMRRSPIASLLDRLERRFTVEHIRLEGFDLAGTSALLADALGHPPPYRVAVALHERTGGNPFFLAELVRAGNNLEGSYEHSLPWSLAETLRRQVEHFGPDQQRLLEAAAVLGHRVSFDLLAAVTDRPEHELIGALRQLVADGVLIESGNDQFTFRHALLREAVGERLLGRERRRLHEAALDILLEAGDADWALLARHARGAGRYEDVLDAARRGSAAYLDLGSAFPALQLAETGLEEADDDADLLGNAARAAWLVGLHDEADSYAQRWQERGRSSEEKSAALRLRVRLAWEVLDFPRLADRSRELEEVLGQLPPGRERVAAMATLAQSTRQRDLDDEAVDWADQAVAMAEGIGDLTAERLAAQVEKGAVLATRAATLVAGQALLTQVADEAEGVGEWWTAAAALKQLVHMPVPMTPDELSVLLERMRACAERSGSENLAVGSYYQGRARLLMRRGDLSAAINAIERARASDLGYRRTATTVDSYGPFLAGLLLECGDLDGAARIAHELSSNRGMDVGQPGMAFHIACRRHQLAAARALVPAVVATATAIGGRTGEFLHDVVSAALAAPLSLSEISQLVAGLDTPTIDPAHRELVAAQLDEASGEHGLALRRFLAVVDPAAGLPPAPRGTAEVGAARCLAALARPDEARAHADAAGQLLAHWGGWRIDQLDTVRELLGLREARSPAARLTHREREVALLVASGLTNVDIARRLYISPRTAAVHVSAILRKLEVPARTKVAAAIEPR